eukprot:4499291-Ditylum_brightwellii.AAC.1
MVMMHPNDGLHWMDDECGQKNAENRICLQGHMMSAEAVKGSPNQKQNQKIKHTRESALTLSVWGDAIRLGIPTASPLH